MNDVFWVTVLDCLKELVRDYSSLWFSKAFFLHQGIKEVPHRAVLHENVQLIVSLLKPISLNNVLVVKCKGDLYFPLKVLHARFVELACGHNFYCNSFKGFGVISKKYLTIGAFANRFIGKLEVLIDRLLWFLYGLRHG